VVTEPIADRLDSCVVGPDGTTRARATLSLVPDDPRAAATCSDPGTPSRAEVLVLADPAAFPSLDPPDPADRPPADGERLEPGTVLATQLATFHADRAPGYLDELSEDHPAFRVERLAHPGWLLRFANWALSRTVRLGPWIHVSSDAWFLRPVTDGDRLEVRSVVTDRFERRGHEFVDLRVRYAVGDDVVGLVDHRAIWQPRTGAN